MSRGKRAYVVSSLGVSVVVCSSNLIEARGTAMPALRDRKALRNYRDIKARRAYDLDDQAQKVEMHTVMRYL